MKQFELMVLLAFLITVLPAVAGFSLDYQDKRNCLWVIKTTFDHHKSPGYSWNELT